MIHECYCIVQLFRAIKNSARLLRWQLIILPLQRGKLSNIAVVGGISPPQPRPSADRSSSPHTLISFQKRETKLNTSQPELTGWDSSILFCNNAQCKCSYGGSHIFDVFDRLEQIEFAERKCQKLWTWKEHESYKAYHYDDIISRSNDPMELNLCITNWSRFCTITTLQISVFLQRPRVTGNAPYYLTD